MTKRKLSLMENKKNDVNFIHLINTNRKDILKHLFGIPKIINYFCNSLLN